MKISEAFTQFGSDKNTYHSYGPFYDSITDPAPKSILEIGVQEGSSMLAWKHVFPDAVVIGIDKDVNGQPFPKNIRMRSISDARKARQKHAAGLLRVGEHLPAYRRPKELDVIQCVAPDFSEAIRRFRASGQTFDLIVDDGSHIEDHQVAAFHFLQEFVAPGGRYVIEDLQSDEIARRFHRSGWEIVDLRSEKGRWDDIIAYKEFPHGAE